MKKIITILTILFLLMPFIVNAEGKSKIDIYIFHSESCPHCKDELKFLEQFTKDNDEVIIHEYETSKNQENAELLTKIKKIMGKESPYIPFTVIGTETFVGFNDNIELKIEETIKAYRKGGYQDLVNLMINDQLNKEEYEKIKEEHKPGQLEDNMKLPIFGNIDPKDVSLPLISIVIGYIDGFNPCSMWVLIFLITLLINMKDRKRMWILGGTFILSEVLVYLCFMFIILNFAISVLNIVYIRAAIGIFAAGAGLYNLQKFNLERKKDTGCQVVSDKKRKKLIEKVKKFTSEKSFVLAMGGIILLSASVTLIGFACSAGLPLLFTQLLALNNLSGLETVIYVGLYMLFFTLNELIIFIVAMSTFKVTGISNKYTKYSHLIGGLIMLILGLLLIFKPAWVMFNF